MRIASCVGAPPLIAFMSGSSVHVPDMQDSLSYPPSLPPQDDFGRIFDAQEDAQKMVVANRATLGARASVYGEGDGNMNNGSSQNLNRMLLLELLLKLQRSSVPLAVLLRYPKVGAHEST